MKRTYILSFLTLVFSASICAQGSATNYGINTTKLSEFDSKINKCIAIEDKLQGETNKKTIKNIKKDLRECKFEFEDDIYSYAEEPDYAKIGGEGAMEIISTLHAACSSLIVISNLREKSKGSTNIFAKEAKKMVCADQLDGSITAYEIEFCKKSQKEKTSCTTVEKMAKNVKARI